MTSHGGRCPHCFGELESGAGPAPEVAPEGDDRDAERREAQLRKFVQQALKPARTSKTSRGKKRRRVR